jgi:hypothetical protein
LGLPKVPAPAGRINGRTARLVGPRGTRPTGSGLALEHLDQPVVQPGHKDDAAGFWDALSRERDAYAAGVEDKLIGLAKAAAA